MFVVFIISYTGLIYVMLAYAGYKWYLPAVVVLLAIMPYSIFLAF